MTTIVPVLAETVRLLTQWTPPAEEEAVRDRIVDHVHTHTTTAGDRSCPGGHVTCSVVLVDPDRGRTLLTLHLKFGRWMQLGGSGTGRRDHGRRRTAGGDRGVGAGDRDRPAAAGSGRLRRHPLRRHPHHPLRRAFLATTTDTATVASEESLDLGWWPLTRLPHPHDGDLALLARQARAALG